MRRILEAGRFLDDIDMINQLQREPVIDIHDDFSGTHRQLYFSEEKLYRYLETGALEISAQQELAKKENCLDEKIASGFEIFDSHYDSEKNIRNPSQGDEKLFQTKTYYLQGKDGVINVSPLVIDSYAEYNNHRMINYFVKATIAGRMAEPESGLVNTMLDYWNEQGLCLMNNVIIDEKPSRMFFVHGSIKTEMAQLLVAGYCKEVEEHVMDVLPTGLSFLCDRMPWLKDGLVEKIKEEFPVRIIRENNSHEF